MTLTVEARPTVASMGEQTEEGMAGVPVVDMTWPSSTTTSQAEATRPEPSLALAVESTTGQMDEGVSRAPKADVAWLGVAVSSEAEVAQPEPSSV
jgi:hypothetical protein